VKILSSTIDGGEILLDVPDAVFQRAQRVHASRSAAPKAKTAPVPRQAPQDYPSGWLPKVAARVRPRRTERAQATTTGSTSDYPTSWRPVGASGRPGESRVTEARD
jgi:hypothetical protein